MRQTGPNPGQWEFDYSAGSLGSLLRALTSTGDVSRGAVPTPYAGTSIGDFLHGAPPAPGTNATAPDAQSRAAETASVISPMSPSYRAGARFGTVTPLGDNAWLPGWRGNLTTPPVTVPPTKEIADAADTGFTAVRRSGWEVPSTATENVARDTSRQLAPDFTIADAPKTYARLDQMTNQPYSSTSVAELMSHYDGLTKVISEGGSDAKAAYAARERVAGMINDLQAHGARPAPGGTPSMPLDEVASTLQTARDNSRSAMSANRISGDLNDAVKGILAEVEANQNVKGANYNVDFQLRNRALAILKDNANVAALLPDEKAALEAIANGTVPRNALRSFGGAFGGTDPLHLMASGGAGYGAGGIWGMAGLPVAGMVAKRLGGAMTNRALQAVEEQTRGNSPLAQSAYDGLLASYSPGIGRDAAITRALMPGLLSVPPAPARKLPPGFI
jgi:hypothetical protein